MPRREVSDTATALDREFGSATFTAQEALTAGVAPHRLWSAVTAGTLVRLSRGRYRVARHLVVEETSGLPSRVAGCIADRIALLAARGVPAALGGIAAAQAWELPLWGIPEGTLPTVFVPRASTARPGVQGAVRVSARDIDPARVVTGPAGLCVTDPLLSSLQVAALPRLSLAERLVVLNGGLRRQAEWETVGLGRLDVHVLARVMAGSATRQGLLAAAEVAAATADVRGGRRVLESLALADPRLETALESVSWARFVEAGIDLPQPQASVRGASGTLWRADFLFGAWVIGECDGAIKYRDGMSLWHEKKRQSDLEAAGYVVVRWTWEEIVHRPGAVLARIAIALGVAVGSAKPTRLAT